MEQTAAAVQAYVEAGAVSNAVAEMCGTPCQDIIDTSGVWNVCGITWADGCGDAEPPAGFTPTSRVSELCGLSCAYYLYTAEQQAKGRTQA